MAQIDFRLLLYVYLFLCIYVIERTIFAFTVPYVVKANRSAWLTSIPFFTYIALFFISVIEFSVTSNIALNCFISVIGVFTFSLGVFLRYQTVSVFRINKQKWISHIDAENIGYLITAGPYKFLRHPYYLSVMLELCGIALLLNSLRAIIFIFLIQAPLLYKRIVVEESELIKKFGEQYFLYKKQIPAILPFRGSKKK